MPTVDQQLSAVFNAWLPFIVAVAAIVGPATVAIWRMMEWRYREQYEKIKALYELTTSEAELANQRAKRREDELTSTITGQADRIARVESLEKQVQELLQQQEKDASKEIKESVSELAKSVADLVSSSSKARDQLARLGQANNAVSAALSDSRRVITSSAPAVHPTSRGRRADAMVLRECPIGGEPARVISTAGDSWGFACPMHGEFEVSGTAMAIREARASPTQWERALERAKRRAKTSGKRPQIIDDDFLNA
jgi:hypothetical protein